MAKKAGDLRDFLDGSDGTRTRDLRRDRPASLPLHRRRSPQSPLPRLTRKRTAGLQPRTHGSAEPAAASQTINPERAKDHNGCNGCIRRSLGFAAVRSPDLKSLQTGGLSERAGTGANARQVLPCRRSWVRVPSSALKDLQIRGPRIRYWQRWRLRGCTCSRRVADRGPATDGSCLRRWIREASRMGEIPARRDSRL
jgi:hypothetical protein